MRISFFGMMVLLWITPAWAARPARTKTSPKKALAVVNVPDFVSEGVNGKNSQMIVLKNLSSGTIVVEKAELSPPFSWGVAPSFPTEIPANGQAAWMVGFQPATAPAVSEEYNVPLAVSYHSKAAKGRKMPVLQTLGVPLRGVVRVTGLLICEEPLKQTQEVKDRSRLKIEITCKNSGNGPLAVTKQAFLGEATNAFVIDSPPKPTIAMGEKAKFIVTFVPSEETSVGYYTKVFHIETDNARPIDILLEVERNNNVFKKQDLILDPGKKSFGSNDENPSFVPKPKKSWRFAVSADIGIGFLKAPTNWYRLVNPNGPSFYPGRAMSNQADGFTHVGMAIQGIKSMGTFDWIWGQLELGVGGGLLPLGRVFVDVQVKADLLSRFVFGKQKAVGLSVFQVGASFAHQNLPQTYQDFPFVEDFDPSQPRVSLQNAATISLGPEFFMNFDPWSKIKGFQMFVRPAYQWYSYYDKDIHQHGMQVTIGFRRWF